MVNVGKADAIIVRADEAYYLIDTATEEMWRLPLRRGWCRDLQEEQVGRGGAGYGADRYCS